MDYEKAYKEAIAKAKQWRNAPNVDKIPTFANRVIDEIFPELKESEGEKIRKALVRFHKSTIDIDGIKGADILAWLEKQGTSAKLSEEEQNSFSKGVLSNCALSFINYLDAHSYEGKMCVSNGECEDIENAFHNAMWDRLHRYYCKYIEKQDEQKPILDFKASNFYVSKVDGKIHDMTYNSTDKVEPKFKIGDWIVNDYCMGRVIEITNDAYLLDTEQGIPFSCEHNVHLWTIKDAKDGDMLIDKNYMGESPFIFKETKPSNIKTDVPNPLTVLGYCGIGGAGFTKSSGWGDTANCIYYPATKEQRDLLFQKMKEAGYEWSDKDRKLIKIVK